MAYVKMSEDGWVDTADAAKALRQELKKAFPGVKFGVRTSKYTGGSSIRVDWFDGPTTDRVKEITRHYQGQSFDGSIDMAYYNKQWALEDGTIRYGGTQGTSDSMGYVAKEDLPAPTPTAKKAHTNCYVFTDRSYTKAFMDAVASEIASKWGVDSLVVVDQGSYGAYIKDTDSKAHPDKDMDYFVRQAAAEKEAA